MSARLGTNLAGAAAGEAGVWDGPRRAAAFAAARRHTRLVRFLRKALPLGCVLVLAGFVGLTRAPMPGGLDFSVARTTISNGAVVMHEPQLTGYDKQHRSFRVTADTASQKLSRPDQVELKKVVAAIQSPDRGEITITAGGGDLDNSENTLALYDSVVVESLDGYRILLESVDVHVKEHRLTSDQPVTVFYQEGETSAERLQVTEQGKLVVLEGRVKTTYQGQPGAAAETPVAATPEPSQLETLR
ncbi:MAG TPA: LPS export ABC transporter periplasmic protein LptC [Afifellaceae bacterium]|nr:LPS export ABC transporter periplasmic protein LptC [Afifellaceae bacterium]